MRLRYRVMIAAGLLALAGNAVSATPVAQNADQAKLLGRVFAEPIRSTNYVQLDPSVGRKELDDGFSLLQKTYPRYIGYTTIAKELKDPTAVSTGGSPLEVITVTDKTVPDTNKQYALLTFAHSAETCGREGVLRVAEDLALAATKAPSTSYGDGNIGGVEHRYAVGDLLKRMKLYIIVTSPDGWKAGDVTGVGYSQDTNTGINSNRIAYQTGWVFSTPLLKEHGYTTSTQPEGIASTRYLRHIRETEMHGRPWAAASDIHGPLPTGAILVHDVGDDPAKRLRLQVLAQRVKQRMNGVFESYVTGVGASAYGAVARQAESVRTLLARFGLAGAIPLVGTYPLQWVEESNIWDLLGYTVSSTWGQFMNDDHVGLGADAISYEINCIVDSPWDPATMQLFVDNVRAIAQTTIVHAAARPSLEAAPPTRFDLKGRVGYYDDGKRITSKDGTVVGVPKGYPGVPALKQLVQEPYDVSQTDFFRQLDAHKLLTKRLTEVTPKTFVAALKKLDTLVISDKTLPRELIAPLGSWVRKGGNLVVTDKSMQLLAKLGLPTGNTPVDVQLKYGYVGYSDFNHADPWADGIPAGGRETYDPVGLGYPLLMNRDSYWTCSEGASSVIGLNVAGSGNCPSDTQNSAPIWTVPTATIQGISGSRIVGTVSPPATRQSISEGGDNVLSNIGMVPLGKGRISYFGALLPTPTEAYPHFYGIFGSTITFAGQQLLLHAMTYARS